MIIARRVQPLGDVLLTDSRGNPNLIREGLLPSIVARVNPLIAVTTEHSPYTRGVLPTSTVQEASYVLTGSPSGLPDEVVKGFISSGSIKLLTSDLNAAQSIAQRQRLLDYYQNLPSGSTYLPDELNLENVHSSPVIRTDEEKREAAQAEREMQEATARAHPGGDYPYYTAAYIQD